MLIRNLLALTFFNYAWLANASALDGIEINWVQSAANEETREEWQEGCETLLKALTPGTGWWGTGVFSKGNCLLNNRPLKKIERRYSWRLNLQVDSEEIAISLVKNFGKNNSKRQSVIKFETTEESMAVFLKPDFLGLFVSWINDQLPASWIISETLTNKRIAIIRGRGPQRSERIDRTFQHPKELILYELRTRGTIWDPKVRGTANLQKRTKMKAKLHQSERTQGERLSWMLNQSSKARGPLFAHRAEGPGVYADSIREDLQDLFSELSEIESSLLSNVTDLIGSTIASGYVGVRYGHPLLSGAIFSDQMSFFGILTEFRGGPLRGLRLFIDIWPEIEETIDEKKATFAAQRTIVGWSFQLELDNPVITGIDLTPKIGVWNFTTDVPVKDETNDTTVIIPFKVKNALSLGAELGIERVTSRTITRAWAAQDFGFSFNEGNSVATSRFGADFVLGFPPASLFGLSFNYSLLVFGSFEIVKVAKEDAGEEDNSAEVGIFVKNLNYNQAYAGAGVAISW